MRKKLDLVIDKSEDETLLVYLGDENVGYANHDEHGWAGLSAVENLAREMARILSLKVTER